MRRLVALLLLLTSFLWQSAVQAGGQWLLDPLDDAGHAVLHWQDEAHHHHDDGSTHADDSGDAFAHVHLDGALQAAALLDAPGPSFGPAGSAVPPPFHRVILPLPPPDGLRRPPRSFA